MAKKKRLKRIIIIAVLSVILLFAVYTQLACLPYAGKLYVSDETKNSYSNQNFYSDTVWAERVKLLNDPEESFRNKINIIEQAQTSILFSTFMFYGGETPDIFAGAILDAADRGVKVEILVNKWSSIPSGYRRCFEEHPNINFYIYCPANVFTPQYLNMSMHIKMLIVDNKYVILGGRNIADKFYVYGTPHFQYDLEVLVYNADNEFSGVVQGCRNCFFDLTDSKLCKKYERSKQSGDANAEKQRLKDCYSSFWNDSLKTNENEYYTETVATNKISLVTNGFFKGSKKESVIGYTLLELAKASKKMTLNSPYIVLTDKNLKLFSEAVKDKEVKLITNSVASSNDPVPCSNYKANRKKYLDTGIEIYEYQNNDISLHGKCYLFDDRLTAIGSFNLNERSLKIDLDIMLIIDSTEFNKVAGDVLDGYTAKSLKVNPDTNEYEHNPVLEAARPPKSKQTRYDILGHLLNLIEYLL